MSDERQINVIIRVRTKSDKKVEYVSEDKSLIIRNEQVLICKNKNFKFDQLYYNNSQNEFYDKVVKNKLDKYSGFGYSLTFMTYGQTGSGKTYTMEGSGLLNSDNVGKNVSTNGLIQHFLMDNVEKIKKFSYFELLYDDVYDLLNNNSKCPKDYQITEKEFEIKEFYKIVKNVKRTFASTLKNTHSSRAHTFLKFTMDNLSKIHFIDLAGSERVMSAGSLEDKQLLKQAISINSSLSFLGKMIKEISENKPTSKRNCRLTSYLYDYFTGKSLTSTIVCISNDPIDLDESYQSLMFANRLKNIKLKISDLTSIVKKIPKNILDTTDIMKELEFLKEKNLELEFQLSNKNLELETLSSENIKDKNIIEDLSQQQQRQQQQQQQKSQLKNEEKEVIVDKKMISENFLQTEITNYDNIAEVKGEKYETMKTIKKINDELNEKIVDLIQEKIDNIMHIKYLQGEIIKLKLLLD